ncbi:MAG: homoserine dehydrogenase [Candidatus Thiodiazotropha sp. (ex Lucina aurantia)]|uniref:Homoserine dehydrogenase n=2 Tax=Candidatus Thiodiazotropha TaxID=1913444 RepID=A0A7Z0VKD4_9GAMM|nr:homoserine dehydrogenase [Candidatus Thiodiazotropha endolucinida]MBT3010306.1 homoserine dehydrogenase [Candidatus Thiodiazotropha sp. (ex Lucina pensylvanica)]MBT3021856.1 homoserine dehydrogenase [Candidatus Thiodiazotropha taylori]MBT3038016.1 homoserine dehydrogenase [Candidatus Thiodiazotropha sp. (ex Codakia orbicularis)]MBV2102385.1 homoserine dehydrogenase [Candidatus Thiodiazotropha sp. (ex Lucina aurantia)]MBT3029685.1 homoserine dehydrogenase [Candidatus Thiodiazotropha sp. (ex 
MNPVKVGLLGLGTVGGGTLNVLTRNADEIARRAGRGIQITHAAAKQYDPSQLIGLESVEVTDDAFSVVENPELEIIIELIGGYTPARELVLKAIENGKHVVTANKALIAMHGNEIFEAAQQKGVMVAFEAAVAGGIPIIKAVREGLAANHIEWIAGIINGTGNFILSEMRDKGREFADVLKEAQALGYAEADPTFDVEGIDAAHKLTILGSIAFGIPLQFEKTYTEGITKIEPQDVEYADQFGYRIKHLGITRKTETGIEMRVHPTMIPRRRLIANVDGVMNAVLVKGDAVGPTLYYGAGAGSKPTASAVVADVVDVVRMLTTDPENRVPHLAFQPGKLVDLAILPIEEVETTFYLRMQVIDRPGVVAKIASILAESHISIEAIQQKEPNEGDNTVPLVMLTQKVIEKQLNKAIAEIEQLETVFGQVMRIRVERLDG